MGDSIHAFRSRDRCPWSAGRPAGRPHIDVILRRSVILRVGGEDSRGSVFGHLLRVSQVVRALPVPPP